MDSGAAKNFVRTSFLDDISRPTTRQTFQLAFGVQDIGTQGDQTLSVTINDTNIQAVFQTLDDLNETCILGAPFLEEQSVLVDFRRKCIYYGKEQRGTCYWDLAPDVEATLEPLPDTLDIPAEFQGQLKPLLEEFSDLFSTIASPSTTTTTKHTICLKEDAVINQKPYPMTPQKKLVFYEQIDEMLQAGVIEPSQSEYSSPPVIIERPNKKPRFCVDYRRLNDLTVDEPSVLPKIPDNIKDLGEAKIFTLLDLKSGYWQIPMAPASKRYTAFSTPDGALYQFCVMPFGLKGAPATFQKLMTNEVLAGYLHKFIKVYLDDILIYSRTLTEHWEHLRLVLERLRIHHLRISPEKCTFATTHLEYLGYQINGTTSQPQQKHITSITTFPVPKTKKSLQGFLGTINWIREYLPDVSRLAIPLTNLLKKDVKYTWSRECQDAFDEIKFLASQPLRLHRPDYKQKFILQTDASLEGLSCVLYQQTDTGEKHIISHASSTLTAAEKRYHINHLECLSIIWAIKKYRYILEDIHFTLRTDSRALLWLQKHKDTKTKLMRWSLLLQEYHFTVEHCPGKENQLPDYLSRNPDAQEQRPEINEERLLPPDLRPRPANALNIIDQATVYEEVVDAQPRSQRIQQDLRRWRILSQNQPVAAHDDHFYTNHTVQDDLLYNKLPTGELRLVVPRAMIQKVIQLHHDCEDVAHPGRDETTRKVKETYSWRAMNKQIGRYVNDCLVCHTAKTRQIQEAAPLKPHPPTSAFEVISIDVLGPYTETRAKNKYIFIVEDTFTKWIDAKPYPRCDGTTLLKFLQEEVIPRYGAPRVIISDNGACFIGRLYRRFCEQSRIQISLTAAEHQRANPVERKVQDLKKVLKVLMASKPDLVWDQYLAKALFVLRTRQNAATQETPSKALLGYEMALPGSWNLPIFRQARAVAERPPTQLLRQKQVVYQRKYAEPRGPPKITFQPGDRVLARAIGKGKTPFGPAWTGPHTVIRKVSDEIYELDREGIFAMLHVDKLRPAPPGNDNDPSSESSDDDDLDDAPVNPPAEPNVPLDEGMPPAERDVNEDVPIPVSLDEDHGESQTDTPGIIPEPSVLLDESTLPDDPNQPSTSRIQTPRTRGETDVHPRRRRRWSRMVIRDPSSSSSD